MSEEEQNIRRKISEELLKQFPDLNPKIAELTDSNFTYELEKHGNYTYYVVSYRLSDSEILTIDWDSAELTVL